MTAVPGFPILADVIAPFMFITGARLLCANIIIALIESFVLRCIFKTGRRKFFWRMLAANYFSAIVGGILLVIIAEVLRVHFQPMLFHLRSYLVTMFVVAMLMSFVLELPFVIASRARQPERFSKLTLACAAAQLGSYAVLLPMYVMVTSTNFYAGVTPIQSLDFVERKSATVVFLSPDERSVCQARLDGSPAQWVMDIGVQKPDTYLHDLTVWKATDSGAWDLWLTDAWNYHLANGTGNDRLLRQGITANYPPQDPNHTATTVDWRPSGSRDWQVELWSNAYAPHHGFDAHNVVTGKIVHIVVDTPFVTWLSRCPTFVTRNQVVFEISGQIVVLDLETRKLGFIAYGHSPAVIDSGSEFVGHAPQAGPPH